MQTNHGFAILKWLVVVAVLGAVGYFGYRYWKKPQAALVAYRTATVSKGNIVQAVTANGALSPVRNVEVGSQISGTLSDIRVDFNSKVKAGEVVAQIDPATYERALGQAEAELANADAAEELAQLNFDRVKELFAENILSKSEYDEARVNLSQAKANVKTRQANVDRAKVDLSRTTIYAPMDGIVITRRVEIGQTVAASMNTPTLFVIANDLKQMQIEAAVSEADVGGVEEGQTVQFDVDAFPGRQFEGKVRQVRYAPTTNQNVVSYGTIVAVNNDDMKLRPGMTANARIITSERRDALKLPNAALRFRPPEGAIVRGDTNAPATTSAAPAATALIESGPFAGLPVMPWQAGGERRRPTDEERAAYTASLTSEQKQKYEQAMVEMRARFAQSGGPGGPGGGGAGGGININGGGERRRAEPAGPKTATIYLLEKESLPMGGEQSVLKPVTVKLGISDGTSTEVIEGLQEGDVVVTGAVLASTTADAGPGGNPFSPFGRGPRPR